jgi:RNA polymerase sigma factor (sigma-70 family)
VVNDGFVKVFRGIVLFECKESEVEKVLMGWMRRIMVNTAIDELRRSNMMPEIGGLPEYIWEETDKSTNADQALLYKELINEIKKLPPSYRTVFNMYVIDGFSHQEIADALGISTGTSKSSLSKARVHLQKFINKNSAEADVCSM